MSPLEDANAILTELNDKVNAGDIQGGKSALAKMKIAMLDFPTGLYSTPAHASMATSALELGVLLSVAEGDLEAFARNMSQLQPYYSKNAILSSSSSSPRKCHILGLNLMHLLLTNRLSEFHSELELLTEEEASTPYLSFPITLERQIMVGSYDEVLNATSPDPSFSLFVRHLVQTVRESIADCLEVSYKTMKLDDVVDRMKFPHAQDLIHYLAKSRDDWLLSEDVVCFQPPEGGMKASDIPSMKWITQSLSYATELERII